MMDVRRALATSLSTRFPGTVRTSRTTVVSSDALAHLLLPVVALGFGMFLLADLVHPLTLILLQLFLSF